MGGIIVLAMVVDRQRRQTLLEPQRTVVDAFGNQANLLREALGCFATGVTVVSGLASNGKPFGLTVNSFSALSLNPPMILWSLRQESPLAAHFNVDARFGIGVLAANQTSLAAQFSAPADDRFAGIEWDFDPYQQPKILGVVAHFSCRVVNNQIFGDHRLLIAAVESFQSSDGEPLIFVKRQFRSFSKDSSA